MNRPERPCQMKAQARGELPEQHFWQQIEKRIKEECDHREDQDEPEPIAGKGLMQKDDNPAENEKIGDGISDENGPKKVFRILQVTVEHLGGAPASPHLLADAQTAESKDASFHARQNEGKHEANGKNNPT